MFIAITYSCWSPRSLLNDNLERSRKKYQSKLRQLERQILQPMMKKQFGKSYIDAGDGFPAKNDALETESTAGTSSVGSSETERSSDIWTKELRRGHIYENIRIFLYSCPCADLRVAFEWWSNKNTKIQRILQKLKIVLDNQKQFGISIGTHAGKYYRNLFHILHEVTRGGGFWAI